MMRHRIPTKFDNAGGVYQIRNEVNGKIYIGRTYHFWWRYFQHCRWQQAIKRKKLTELSDFEEEYQRYGSDNFVFEIIEVIEDKKAQIERERLYIRNWLPEYNQRKRNVKPIGIHSTTTMITSNRKYFKRLENLR